jgi:hypothetical protein
MKILAIFPLFALLLIGYNITLLTGEIEPILQSEVFSTQLISGALWSLNVHDLFIIFGVIVLYIEIIKATRTGVTSVLDHTLSTLVFVLFLIEFLVNANCGTSTFFILMLMSLLDIISGFAISIISARRDFSVGGS